MTLIKKYWLYFLVIFAPVIVNYAFFTWRAPSVYGDANSWLGFFANYLGFIGAVGIATFQLKKQKEREVKSDREHHRSLLVVQDFTAPIKLKKVITHENSRIILTPGYEDLLKRLEELKRMKHISEKQYHNVTIAFLKISHHGNSEVILNCRIQTVSREEDSDIAYDLDINIGVVEKGIEVFVPLVPPGIEMGRKILLDKVIIDYYTLRNEHLRYVHDLINQKDILYLIGNTDEEDIHILYCHDLIGSQWIYPNKIDHFYHESISEKQEKTS